MDKETRNIANSDPNTFTNIWFRLIQDSQQEFECFIESLNDRALRRQALRLIRRIKRDSGLSVR